ncbi:MAG: carbon-nitrogen hydrolase [Thaumarchaeota archaeon]|nr:carbon-nitrogen hydrolase [Nitrososphaerota archaeon]
MKLGLVQMGMVEDRQKNLSKATRMVGAAASGGAQVVCLPELFDVPYFPQEERSSVRPEKLPNDATSALSESARENEVVLVGGSIFERSEGKSYNTATVYDERGRMLGAYRKVHIPQDPGFYEQDYFAPGNDYRVFETRYGRIGVLICFDQWYPEAARATKLLGADFLFYPTAIGTVKGIEQTEGDWQDAWETVQRGHAIANSVVVAAVNRVGVEKETTFWGGSFVCDQFGKLLAKAGAREQVLVAACEVQLGRDIERGWGFLRNRRPATYRRLVGSP